jgi:putative spermidine/putrescine transport system ATP-binding protein
MAFLELHDIVKSFGKNTVVKRLNLNVDKGEFISLLGGSGCGKTTTLRMIAGFETPDEGTILVDGKDVAPLAPNKRKLGMVFQNYALFPNMNVRKNIGFGLSIAGAPKAEIEKRVDEMLEVIHMEDFGLRYPHQLSGGQQQRVALARALAPQPEALLLDEPLSALDAKIRVKLRDDIRAIQRRLGITTIYVTHDQEEALSISDRVAVMREGVIEQIGTPFEIYNRPATPYVSSFIGTLNVLVAKVVDPAKGDLEVSGQKIRAGAALDAAAGSELVVAVRPEAFFLEPGNGDTNSLAATVENIKFLGSVVRLVARAGQNVVSADSFNTPSLALPRIGEEVKLWFAPESCSPLATAARAEIVAASEEGTQEKH